MFVKAKKVMEAKPSGFYLTKRYYPGDILKIRDTQFSSEEEVPPGRMDKISKDMFSKKFKLLDSKQQSEVKRLSMYADFSSTWMQPVPQASSEATVPKPKLSDGRTGSVMQEVPQQPAEDQSVI